VEVGSSSGVAIAQANQSTPSQQVSRNDQAQRQTVLESPAPQQNAPQPGQRVGSIINTQA
jgi:hypothetical protein